MKNSASAAARAVRRIPARHRVALTGTPVENRLTELWSIVDFLNPGLLGPAQHLPGPLLGAGRALRRRRTRPPGCGGSPGPFLLRRVKTDRAVIADLPDKLERTPVVQPDPRAGHALPGGRRRAVRQAARGARRRPAQGPGAVRDDEAQAGLQPPGAPARRRLAAGGPVGQAGPPRGDPRDRARRRRPGAGLHPVRPVRRAADAATCAARLGAASRSCTAAPPRAPATRWCNASSPATGPGVLLLSLKAGGTGLNLTAANHVVHVDRWWNPATETQATDRAFRIGQRRDVQVHTLRLPRHDRGARSTGASPRSGRSPGSPSAAARAGSPDCPPTTCST